MDFWFLLLIAVVVIAPGLAITGFVMSLTTRKRLKKVEAWIANDAGPVLAGLGEGPQPRPETTQPTQPERAPAAPAKEPLKPEPQARSRWKAVPKEPEKPSATRSAPTTPRPAVRKPVSGSMSPGLEERLTSSWLVWLGGIALALGGAFLVKYSIDQGWFGPALRVSAGVSLGIVLTAGGEWLRRRPLQQAIAAVRADFVPGALTAAGVSIAFGSIYAAHALYDLIPALIAFLALAVIAVAAIALSLWQGTFVAILGVLGAFLTPILVSTGESDPYTLFPYLLAVTAAAVWIAKYRDWWWLNVMAALGSLGWVLLWVGVWDKGDILAVGPYAIAVAALFLLVRRETDDPKATAFSDFPMQIAFAAAAASAILMFLMVQLEGYDLISRGMLAGLAGQFVWYAWTEEKFDLLAPLAALMVVLSMLSWYQPVYLPAATLPSAPVTPPELMPYLLTSTAFGLAFLLAGYLALRKARRPALWAIISAATPLVLMINAYWRVENFETSISWALTALGLALIFAAAARRFADDEPQHRPVLATYAVAVVAALILGATMVLRDAWLTVAFAAMLPAVAWIESKVPEPGLRRLAMVLATIVLVRLALNPYVLDYQISGVAPGVNWLLYGYGLPAAMFWLASRMFKARGDDKLVATLEAGALVFLTLLISLELRHVFSPDGRLDRFGYDFAEMAINTAVWGVSGLILLRGQLRHPRFVFKYGWMVYAGLAIGQVVALHLLFMNPYFTGEKVGFTPVFNLLLLLYALPAVIAIGYMKLAARAGAEAPGTVAGIVALVLSFVWLTLEIRHAFHGTRLDTGTVTDAEWWTYSAGWLLYGLVLLGLGLWRKSAALRYASLALVMLTVAKVFLSDLAALEGLLRALSFLGLGAALVGIGFFYQRFVFARPATKQTGEQEA